MATELLDSTRGIEVIILLLRVKMINAMTKIFWLGLSLSLMLATSVRAGLTAEEIYEKISPAVLTLEVENAQKEKFVGSAFLTSRPGLAVTAWHVVHDAQKIQARFPGDRSVKVLGLLAKDEAHDLAIIEIDSKIQPQLTLAAEKPRVGAKVYVIGTPQGLDFSLAEGLISQVRELGGICQYQLSCPISPGNSGGPVVNDRGEIVGMVSWRKPDAQNVSFAIPSFEVTRLLAGQAKTPVPVGEFADKKTIAPNEPVVARQSPDGGLVEFQKALSAHAGRKVTVTLEDGQERKSFTFAPPARKTADAK